MISHLIIYILKTYKKYISPVFVMYFGHGCRYSPTCSEYAITALSQKGLLMGSVYSVKRFLSCNPLSDNITGITLRTK